MSINTLIIQIKDMMHGIHKNICACLFSVHNTISLSGHEQVCLIFRLLMGEVSLET